MLKKRGKVYRKFLLQLPKSNPKTYWRALYCSITRQNKQICGTVTARKFGALNTVPSNNRT